MRVSLDGDHQILVGNPDIDRPIAETFALVEPCAPRGPRILSAKPRAKPSGLSADTVAIGSPVLVEISSVHSCCCFGGTTFPPKTARIQRSTSRGLEMAPPADCIQEVLTSRMSRPTIGRFHDSLHWGW